MAVGPQHMLGKLIAVVVIASALFVLVLQADVPRQRPVRVRAGGPIQPVGAVRRVRRIGRAVPDGSRKLKPGDRVEKGQLLAKLETYENEQKLAEAQKRMAIKEKESANYLGAGKDRRGADRRSTSATKPRPRRITIRIRSTSRDPRPHRRRRSSRATLRTRRRARSSRATCCSRWASRTTSAPRSTSPSATSRTCTSSQQGWLATNSLPDVKKPFTIERVIPIGETKEGGNNFKVYAKLGSADRSLPSWRAGMQGEARIEVRHERLAWIWTHRLIDFLKLKLWM